MSDLPISSKYRSTPDAPVTEADRNELGTRLNDAFTEGKLDADDYRMRLDRLFAARRLGELVPVVEGLPPLQTHHSPAIVGTGSGRPGELAETRSAHSLALVGVGVVTVSVLVVLVLLLVLIF